MEDAPRIAEYFTIGLVAAPALLAAPYAQASVLDPVTTYNMFIRTGTSCYEAGDCTDQYSNGGFTDNGDMVAYNGKTYGSSIGGDGWAGVIRFRTDAGGDSFSVLSYNLDMYPPGPPDAFVTWADNPGLMTGTMDAAGNMTFTPTGRMAFSGFFPHIGAQPWNIDDSTNLPQPTTGDWTSLTTGTSTPIDAVPSCSYCNHPSSLTGSPLTSDGQGGWNAVLVSASNFGDNWGPFSGSYYTEVWDVNIQAVPIPSAVWLFGTGLVALVGLERRLVS